MGPLAVSPTETLVTASAGNQMLIRSLDRDYRRRFWAGCEWSLFLPPAPGGFAEARQHKACAAGTAALQRRPAVYEFAITAGRSPKRWVNRFDMCAPGVQSRRHLSAPHLCRALCCSESGFRGPQHCTSMCRFKVYVGETVSMWRRHHTEYQVPAGADGLASTYPTQRWPAACIHSS